MTLVPFPQRLPHPDWLAALFPRRAAPAAPKVAPLFRRLADLDHFAREVAATGPCAEVEATMQRLERDIRALCAPGQRRPDAQLQLELDVYAAVEAGELHPRLLDAFDLVLLPATAYVFKGAAAK